MDQYLCAIYPDPLPIVVTALQTYTTYDMLADNLPDLAVAARRRPMAEQRQLTAFNI